MNINIRNYISDNFKDSSNLDIKNSIEDSIKEKEDITLPGLGVFFEILWSNSSEKEKNNIIDIIKANIIKK